MSDYTDRLEELTHEIEEARARATQMPDEDRKVMDVGIKQLEKERNEIQAIVDRDREYEELEKAEDGPWASLFHSAFGVVQFDYWYLESVEQLDRDQLQVFND